MDRCAGYTGVLNWSNLERPGSFRLLPAEVDLAGDGQTHEEPVAKAIVVDELKDVLHRQVDQRHDTLDSGRKKRGRLRTGADVNDLM